MTYRLIVALVAAVAFTGMSLAGSPVPTAVMEHPIPAPTYCPTPAVDERGPIWFGADYLLSYVYGNTVQPLVTTSPVTTPRISAGVIGSAGTVSLFDGRVNTEERSGVRVEGGMWLDAQREYCIEAGFSIIESQATLFSAYNAGNAILARPYLNANTLQSNADNPAVQTHPWEAVLITYPDFASGGIDIRVSSGNFYEFHADLSENLWNADWFRLDGMIGYRFYRYDEALSIRQISTSTNDLNLIPGTQIYAGDDFTTLNEFHGCELGVRSSFQYENLTIDLLAKLAAGNLRRKITIAGAQQVRVPGQPVDNRVGGVFALSSNIGTYYFNDMAAMPELGINFRYRVSDYLRLRLGYNILFLEGISRANQQISNVINPNLFPGSGQDDGPQQPAPTNVRDNVWIMNVGFGMEVIF